MGNVIGSFISGFAKVIGNLFGSPLDFLAGKSCSSVCGSTWDFICYIENFCVSNLLKMASVLVLCFIVLLLLYLLYKLGIFECICWSLCRITWACISCWFSVLEYFCTFLCINLTRLKRKKPRRRKYVEETDTSDEAYVDQSFSCHEPKSMGTNRSLSRRWRDHRGDHISRSLRPRSHRVLVGISRDSGYGYKRGSSRLNSHVKSVHDIRVTRTSKFVQKGRKNRRGAYRCRRQ